MTTERTLRGRDVFSQETIEVQVADGHVARVSKVAHVDDGVWLCPGFVDIQVNGYDGVDFNDDSCDIAAIERLTERLAELGTTTFLPTIITASQQAMKARVRAVVEARKASSFVRHAVPCIHLEGPCISPMDGYRGAHPLADVRDPSIAEFKDLQEGAEGLIGLVTLSPHWSNASEFIRWLTKRGVVVALGHTHASPEMICTAVEAGAQLSTHLGNGIAAQLPRHPNAIWTQLADDRLTASFIADGIHLDADVLRVMMRAKGIERSVLVSDSVSLAGSSPGQYKSNIGQAVIVGKDGSIRMRDGGLLAGSGIALRDAIARVGGMLGYTLADAVRMATVNPARFIGGRKASIAVGENADVVLLRWLPRQRAVEIEEVLVLGRSVRRNEASGSL